MQFHRKSSIGASIVALSLMLPGCGTVHHDRLPVVEAGVRFPHTPRPKPPGKPAPKGCGWACNLPDWVLDACKAMGGCGAKLAACEIVGPIANYRMHQLVANAGPTISGQELAAKRIAEDLVRMLAREGAPKDDNVQNLIVMGTAIKILDRTGRYRGLLHDVEDKVGCKI